MRMRHRPLSPRPTASELRGDVGEEGAPAVEASVRDEVEGEAEGWGEGLEEAEGWSEGEGERERVRAVTSSTQIAWPRRPSRRREGRSGSRRAPRSQTRARYSGSPPARFHLPLSAGAGRDHLPAGSEAHPLAHVVAGRDKPSAWSLARVVKMSRIVSRTSGTRGFRSTSRRP